MSVGAISSLSSTTGLNAIQQFDPEKMKDNMIKRFLQDNDTDGDGMLSTEELSGLSSEAFAALDTDGDGSLNTDEIKTAMETAMENMKQASSSMSREEAMSALSETPEGQLMELMRPQEPPRGMPVQDSDESSSSINITINQTIYNINGASELTDILGSGLNITA